MQTSRIALHPDGLTCSRLIWGVWRLAEWNISTTELRSFIDTCLELGITTFDHADIYGEYTCESLFGEALKTNSYLRDRMQLVSKYGIKLVSPNRPEHTLKHYDTSQQHLLASVENSLQNLQTDRLDLLLIHRPDPFMNADEVAEAFTKLRQAGKVLYFGVSNFTPSQFDLLASRLDFPLITNQIELSVMHLTPFEDGTLEQCQRLRIAPMAWSPLGGGELFSGETPKVIRLRQALEVIAQELNATIDQIALAWLLAHPVNIVPILGSGNLDRIRSAVGAERFHLPRVEWVTILIASTGVPVP
ncbi:oxidoreductase [filamentous cyanobacterium CCP2]|nr:oxidoreductase [filamentous cyanobacterium CCP2]